MISTLILTLAFSAPPGQLSVQGALRNDAGAAPDGPYGVIFSLWDAASGGNELWQEVHSGDDAISVEHGAFDVLLGKKKPIEMKTLMSVGGVWLEFQVGLEAPLGRQRITSVPYALIASHAASAYRLNLRGRSSRYCAPFRD